MRKLLRSLYAVVFTAAMCGLSAMIVTAAHLGWKDLQERHKNKRRDNAILLALGITSRSLADVTELNRLYERDIRRRTTRGLTVYESTKTGADGYAFKVEGAGRCGLIRGILAVEPDRRTVRALRFYYQDETPGLGSRISTPHFACKLDQGAPGETARRS